MPGLLHMVCLREFPSRCRSNFMTLDMADHYGDAEVTFGSFRNAQTDAANIVCATKYCVFEPITITKEIVETNVSERLSNINADSVELLQLHWQFVSILPYLRRWLKLTF